MHTGNVIFDAYNPTPGATYTWDFGDGTSASGVDLLHVSHNYAPGTYVVTLTKYNFSIGCSATVSNTIEVVPGTCIADFINVTPPDVIDTLYLANNSTYSPTMTFTWDFGDGTILTGPNPYHIYGSSGTYNVCLTISDASGCLDTYCMVFTISLMSGNGERSGFPVIFLPLVYGSALGVEDDSQKVDFSVYPNPAKDNLMISFGTNFPEQADVQIYDLSGRVIKTFSVHHIAGSGVINLEGVAAGTYSISITDKVSGSTSSVLFVKE
jgi:PKD repeat protein